MFERMGEREKAIRFVDKKIGEEEGIRLKTYILEVKLQQNEDERWSAWVPSLKGCAAWGHTRQEAIQAIRDAAEIYIEDMIEAGEKLKFDTMGIEVKEEVAIAITV